MDQSWIWPAGCVDRLLCLRHTVCMYLRCPHTDRDIDSVATEVAVIAAEEAAAIAEAIAAQTAKTGRRRRG